jgi:class 3 adenylate cyclase
VIPETRFARTADGFDIAYQVLGDGPPDILMIPAWVSHLEIAWENPLYARFMERVATFARVISFDKRGTGLSSRLTTTPDLDARLDDARAVLDDVGTNRAAIWGDGSDGTALGILHAATFPGRTAALVLWEPTARNAWAPDHPWGPREADFEREQEEIRSSWGTREWARAFASGDAPSLARYPELLDSYAKYFRYSATPSDALLLNRIWFDTDVRDLLPSARVPVLVLTRGLDADPEGSPATFVADRIPGARLVQLEGADFPKWLGDQATVVDEVRSFLTGVRLGPDPDRVLATVLFTDIVASTETIAAEGDATWREVVERHHAIVRGLLETYRGIEVDTAGDGFFATFDGPTRAVRCAHAIRDAVVPLGIRIRAGLHTGEIDVGGAKATGIAVAIGARVAAVASPHEIIVSSTLKDLVAGSGLSFEAKGEHELKGVPGRWQLFALKD